jgi:hypothetical protein
VAALRSVRPFRAARAIAGAIAGAAACAVGTARASAQSAHQLEFEVAASHARPPAGLIGDPASYLTAALHWLHTGRIVAFGGLGAGVAAVDEGDGWVSAYGGTRLDRSLSPALVAGVSASAIAFRIDRPDAYNVAELRFEPELRIGDGATQLTVQLHGGVARAGSRLEDGSLVEDRWSAGGALRVERALGRSRIGAGATAYETATGTFASGGGTLETWFGAVRANLNARVWSVPDAGATGTVQLRLDVPLTRVLRAVAAGGRSDPDPLLDARAGTYASGGIVWDVLATTFPPPPALIELLPARGSVRFTVTPPEGVTGATSGAAGGVTTVEIMGDFSVWQPIPLREIEPGRWSVELPIAGGIYHFVFRVDGELWLPADAPGRGQDEWGRPTATLVVPDA